MPADDTVGGLCTAAPVEYDHNTSPEEAEAAVINPLLSPKYSTVPSRDSAGVESHCPGRSSVHFTAPVDSENAIMLFSIPRNITPPEMEGAEYTPPAGYWYDHWTDASVDEMERTLPV